MNVDLKTAIVLITSKTDRKWFGTGFVIHCQDGAAYIVTCAHVIRPMAETDIIADEQPVTIVAQGDPDNIDLLVLQVATPLRSPKLPIAPVPCTSQTFWTVGFCKRGEQHIARPMELVLEKEGSLGAIPAWWLRVVPADCFWEAGNSGCPIVDAAGRVIGLLARSEPDSNSKVGIAIAIAALKDIWPAMPANLIAHK